MFEDKESVTGRGKRHEKRRKMREELTGSTTASNSGSNGTPKAKHRGETARATCNQQTSSRFFLYHFGNRSNGYWLWYSTRTSHKVTCLSFWSIRSIEPSWLVFPQVGTTQTNDSLRSGPFVL